MKFTKLVKADISDIGIIFSSPEEQRAYQALYDAVRRALTWPHTNWTGELNDYNKNIAIRVANSAIEDFFNAE